MLKPELDADRKDAEKKQRHMGPNHKTLQNLGLARPYSQLNLGFKIELKLNIVQHQLHKPYIKFSKLTLNLEFY